MSKKSIKIETSRIYEILKVINDIEYINYCCRTALRTAFPDAEERASIAATREEKHGDYQCNNAMGLFGRMKGKACPLVCLLSTASFLPYLFPHRSPYLLLLPITFEYWHVCSQDCYCCIFYSRNSEQSQTNEYPTNAKS